MELENTQDLMIGIILLSRYVIIKQFNSDGAHGTVYLAKDEQTGQLVLAKITEDQEMNFKEHSILMALMDNEQNFFP
jgi:serine/threonine protein kinase